MEEENREGVQGGYKRTKIDEIEIVLLPPTRTDVPASPRWRPSSLVDCISHHSALHGPSVLCRPSHRRLLLRIGSCSWERTNSAVPLSVPYTLHDKVITPPLRSRRRGLTTREDRIDTRDSSRHSPRISHRKRPQRRPHTCVLYPCILVFQLMLWDVVPLRILAEKLEIRNISLPSTGLRGWEVRPPNYEMMGCTS